MPRKTLSIDAKVSGQELIFDTGAQDISLGAWYDLYISFQNEQPSCVNALMDFGNGLSNCFQLLFYKEEQDRFRARVFIDRRPERIRFIDLAEGSIASELSFQYCSKAKIYGHLAVRSAKTFLADPVANTPRLARNFRHFIKDKSFSQIRPSGVTEESAYKAWIEKYDFKEADQSALEAALKDAALRPKISILIPLYKSKLDPLKAALQSVSAQIYTDWEACLCVDGEIDAAVMAYLETLCADDPRFKMILNAQNMGIAAATNQAFSLASGEWTTFLDHDDLLRPQSLAVCVKAINETPSAKLIYSDEDKIDDEGRRFDPYFKCDFSDELILAMNYFNHLTMIKTDEIRKVGKWNSHLDGAQDYDMVLRVLNNIERGTVIHIPQILYHWRASIDSEARTRNVKTHASAASRQAVETYLKSKDFLAVVETCAHSGYNRVKLQNGITPKISIIIPTRNQKALLKTCMSSIFAKTTYANFEVIIVDNGSDEAATKAYMVEQAQNPIVTVLSYDKPFNYSAINNFAIEQAKGELICLLNNDIEVLSEGWLEEMQSWLQIEGVGCVGAKLLYPNKTVQHGGVILGIAGIAGHAHKYFPQSKLGYYGRLAVAQNFSAVTAACMLFAKQDFLSVGGLNAEDLAVSYNDVDLCLKFGAKGLRTVWTPYAELTHFESVSRGKHISDEKREQWSSEAQYMRQTWADVIDNDPYYSENLSRIKEDFSFRM